MKLTAPAYPDELIRHCLSSDDETLIDWGAIQRIEGVQRPSELLELLEMPRSVVQEAALYKLAHLESEEAKALVPLAVRLFRESTNQLKYQAANCLSQFPSDFTIGLLSRWASACLSSDQSTQFELETAVLTWLAVDPKATDSLLERLNHFQDNPMLSRILFRYLLPHCMDEERFSKLVDFYFFTRDHHADIANTHLLMDRLADPQLGQWIQQSLVRGQDLVATYSQLCSLLGDLPLVRWQSYWHKMDQAGVRFDGLIPSLPQDPALLISAVKTWLEALPGSPRHPVALWLINGFERNLDQFSATIPKLVEIEIRALLALVPSLLLEQCLDQWLLKPAAHLELIANFYHSPLSSPTQQERILKFFFPEEPDWTVEQCALRSGEPTDIESLSKGEIIWRFFSGDLLGMDLPWASWFPDPSLHSGLMSRLLQVYLANFDHWVEQGDPLNIDYGLQLFGQRPCTEALDLLVKHFAPLQQNHADLFYQLIQQSPDLRLIDPLVAVYRQGEYQLAGLINFLCRAFQQRVPKAVSQDLELQKSFQRFGRTKPVRLKCHRCGHSYQYFAEVLYVDEGDILRTGRLSSKSIWTPNPFRCKGCESHLPLEFDEVQLEKLTLQSKAEQILKQRLGQSGFGQRIVLIQFPRHLTQSYNPDEFELLIKQLGESNSLNQSERALLRLKAVRMYIELSRYHDALASLAQIAELPAEYRLEVMYLTGVCRYRLRDFAQARPLFDQVLCHYGDQKEQPFLEESRSFLASMSENRQRFLVIEGGR